MQTHHNDKNVIMKKIILLVIFCLFFSYYKVTAGSVQAVNTINDLQKIEMMNEGDIVIVSGYLKIGDGGGGIFRWNSQKSDYDDGGIIFKSTKSESGRWLRILEEQSPINVRWFGVWGDGNHNDYLRIQKAINTARDNHLGIYISKGDYVCENSLYIKRDKLVHFRL